MSDVDAYGPSRYEPDAPEERGEPGCGGGMRICRVHRRPIEDHGCHHSWAIDCPGCTDCCAPRSETDGGLIGALFIAEHMIGLAPTHKEKVRELREQLEAWRDGDDMEDHLLLSWLEEAVR